jgi:PAS domain S-box-containing protein
MAPLSVRGKVVGVISFAYSDSGREFTKSDMPIIEAITHRAALLLDNAMLFATTSRLLQAQEKTLQDLTESENTLRLALDAGDMGVWDYDIPANSINWSDGFKPIYGIHRGNAHGTFQKFINHILPIDKIRVRKKLLAAIQGESRFEEEFRVKRSDGQIRWIHKIGEILRDSSGQAVRVVGIGTDITERKLIEEKIRQSENKFKSVFDGSLDMIMIIDDQMKISDINLSGCDFLQTTRSKVLNTYLLDYICPSSQKDFLKTWKKLQKLSSLRGSVEMDSPDNKKHIMEYNANAQFLPGQSLFVLRDITKRVEEENRRQHLLGIASHELRTPISSIKVFVDILRRQFKSSKNTNVQSYLEKIDDKTDIVTQLVNNLLDVARIDEGKLEFSWEMFDFASKVASHFK